MLVSRSNTIWFYRLECTGGEIGMAIILFYGFLLYVSIGIVIGIAFVTAGVARVLPHASVTAGARILWLPGAAVFWPYVLMRWCKARGAT